MNQSPEDPSVSTPKPKNSHDSTPTRETKERLSSQPNNKTEQKKKLHYPEGYLTRIP